MSRIAHQVLDLKRKNEKLQKLIYLLGHEIREKTGQLTRLEKDLKKTTKHLEHLSRLITSVYPSSSIKELEERLLTSFHGALPIKKVIVLKERAAEAVREIKKIGAPSLVFPLMYQKKCIGNIYYLYAGEEARKVLYERLDFLKQISDVVSLTLAKIHIFDESVRRKSEWEKTFDAIRDPVSLVSPHYEVVRANRAYSDVSQVKIQNLIGRKCYEVFQKRDSPCEGCQLRQAIAQEQPKAFELKSVAQNTFYATASYPSALQPSHAVMYYRDQGEEMKLRNQLIQTEKMAEIGILSGSIAHEINNPLGGILAYTQILLSEVDKKSSLYADFKEIENAALRSKNIVESLLHFSRMSYKIAKGHGGDVKIENRSGEGMKFSVTFPAKK